MRSALIRWYEARFKLACSLKLPYLAFLSGGLLGAVVTAAFGALPVAGGVADSPIVSSGDRPVGQSSAPAQPAGIAPEGHDPSLVYYYIVDTGTRASVLAGAMPESTTTGNHPEFVIVRPQDNAETLIGLDMALLELSAAGVPVKLVDLR